MHACNKKHAHIVQWLLATGADINKQDYVKQTNKSILSNNNIMKPMRGEQIDLY
jgi:hypothetical protein